MYFACVHLIFWLSINLKKGHRPFGYLSICFLARLISLAEVEQQLVSTFLTQFLHNVQCALAQGLTHRVEEYEDQIGLFSCTEIEESDSVTPQAQTE